MSVRVMSRVWEIALPDSEKLVLLALADAANDEGLCWPSMRTLADKCSKSDRTVQAAIKELVSKGHLSRIENPGKGCRYYVHPVLPSGMEGTNPTAFHYIYRITAVETGEFYVGARSTYHDPEVDSYMGSGAWVKTAKADGLSLRKDVLEEFPSREALAVAEQELTRRVIQHPLCRNKRIAAATNLSHFGGLTPEEAAPRNPRAPKRATPTPEAASDKPSRTVNGLSNDKPIRAKGWPEIPDWMPVRSWNAYLEMRKGIRKMPTPHAAELLIDKLDRWRAKGHDPGMILDNSTENSWTGIFEPRTPANDHRPRNSSTASAAEIARQHLGC